MVRRLGGVHVPRTGGTSLWTQLAAAFGDGFLADYAHDPICGPYDMQPWPDGKTVIHGHFRPDLYNAELLITWLRHPVDLVTSLWHTWLTLPPMHSALRKFHDMRPSLIEFAQWPEIRWLLSKTYFGGFDMRRFDFIGVFERRDKDFLRLSHMLDVPLDPAIHENRSQRWNSSNELLDILADDIAFYLTQTG